MGFVAEYTIIMTIFITISMSTAEITLFYEGKILNPIYKGFLKVWLLFHCHSSLHP